MDAKLAIPSLLLVSLAGLRLSLAALDLGDAEVSGRRVAAERDDARETEPGEQSCEQDEEQTGQGDPPHVVF